MNAVDFVMLATADDDVGVVSFEAMTAAGQDAADSLEVTVMARDAVTDAVLAVFDPRELEAVPRVREGRAQPRARPTSPTSQAAITGGLFCERRSKRVHPKTRAGVQFPQELCVVVLGGCAAAS